MAHVTKLKWAPNGETGVPKIIIELDLLNITDDMLSMILFDQHIVGSDIKRITVNGMVKKYTQTDDITEFDITSINQEKLTIGSPVIMKCHVKITEGEIEFNLENMKYMDFDGSSKFTDLKIEPLKIKMDKKFAIEIKKLIARSEWTRKYFADMYKLRDTYTIYKKANVYKIKKEEEYHLNINMSRLEGDAIERRDRFKEMMARFENGEKSAIYGMMKASKWLDGHYLTLKNVYRKKAKQLPTKEDIEEGADKADVLFGKFITHRDEISDKYPDMIVTLARINTIMISPEWQECRIAHYINKYTKNKVVNK